MKHWKETREVLERAAELARAGRRTALATVVRIEGSAYRRPGAKFLVEADGRTSGSVSGGCLEADVREAALEVIRTGAPRLLRYDTGADDRSVFGLGMGCGGTVEVFVQSASDGAALETARAVCELLSGESAFAVSTVVKGAAFAGRVLVVTPEGVRAGSTGDPSLDRGVSECGAVRLARRESGLDRAGESVIFTEVLSAPPPLIVFGAGDDAIPLCRYAAEAGFRVTVVDHREDALAPERFPGAARRLALRPEEGIASLPVGPRAFAVIKYHSFRYDREWTRHMLAAGVPYIGLLGPRARADEILSQIGASGGDRIFAPVGLDLGAEGPEQVALAILAELLAVHASREPWSLREKRGAIHAT
jgi:xanthine/CO dehydrogenase XdhC/CoxF family maturation factor